MEQVTHFPSAILQRLELQQQTCRPVLQTCNCWDTACYHRNYCDVFIVYPKPNLNTKRAVPSGT